MSSRFEEKHEDIVAAAFKVFVKNGFLGTSMDKVAKVAGVSKATVYNHFEDKVELFKHVMIWHCETLMASAQVTDYLAKNSLREKLRAFADGVTRALLDKRSIDFVRVVVFETGQFPELGKAIWGRGIPLVLELSRFLEREQKAGRLKIANTSIAARQFLGLIKENSVWPILMGASVENSPQSIKEVNDLAVEMFLRMYKA